jgi:hypothetical protein
MSPLGVCILSARGPEGTLFLGALVLAAEHCCGWKGLLIHLSHSPVNNCTMLRQGSIRMLTILLCLAASTATPAKIPQLKCASSHPVSLKCSCQVSNPITGLFLAIFQLGITDGSQHQLSIVGDAETGREGIRSSQHGKESSVDPVVCAVTLRRRCLWSFLASSYSSAALNTNPLKSNKSA